MPEESPASANSPESHDSDRSKTAAGTDTGTAARAADRTSAATAPRPRSMPRKAFATAKVQVGRLAGDLGEGLVTFSDWLKQRTTPEDEATSEAVNESLLTAWGQLWQKWVALLEPVRSRLPRKLAPKLTDSRLTGLFVGIIVFFFVAISSGQGSSRQPGNLGEASRPVASKPRPVAKIVQPTVVARPYQGPPRESAPVVTKPVVTEPVVTEPVVTEPVVTEPVVTEPVVTAPATDPPGAPAPVVPPVPAASTEISPAAAPRATPAAQESGTTSPVAKTGPTTASSSPEQVLEQAPEQAPKRSPEQALGNLSEQPPAEPPPPESPNVTVSSPAANPGAMPIAPPIAPPTPKPAPKSPSTSRPAPAIAPAAPAAAKLTPEQQLIVDIETQVKTSASHYGDGIISSLRANFDQHELVIKLGEPWFELEESAQDAIAEDLHRQAASFDFTRLRILDRGGHALVRSPVVGDQMIILQRRRAE